MKKLDFGVRWLLSYESGAYDIEEQEPDFSNDRLHEIPIVTLIYLQGIPLAQPYYPQTENTPHKLLASSHIPAIQPGKKAG